ncbi:MAG: S8 family serine peptidase [Bacteroidota bacterium]
MLKQLLFAVFACLTIHAQAQTLKPQTRLVLQFKTTPTSAPRAARTGNDQIDQIHARYGALQAERFQMGKGSRQYFYVVIFPETIDLQSVIQEDLKTGALEYAEPDHVGSCAGVQGLKPNDTNYAKQWSLNNNGTFSQLPAKIGADIDMENAWAIETGDASIIVAIIDSGAKLDHPEFSGRIWVNPGEIAGNGLDDDADGKIDDVNGWDFAYNDNTATDDLGHGTNVAGIIGANGNNNQGYAGVDWQCKLMILKAIDVNNFGYYTWWADAMYYAIDHGARVINMSLGGSSSSTLLQNAVNYAVQHNVIISVSMMNFNTGAPYYPAAIPGVIAVGSTNPDDKRTHPFFWDATSGSNYGNHISVVAPGNYIYGLHYQSNTNYNTYWGGTSQAAPHVAGLAALLLAQNPNRNLSDVRSIIENTAEDKVGDPAEDVAGWDQYYGHGRINAFKALSAASGVFAAEQPQLTFAVLPNPARQSFKLVRTESGSAVYTIFNMYGQQVYEVKTEAAVLDLRPNLAPGLYQVVVKSGNRFGSTKLLIQ